MPLVLALTHHHFPGRSVSFAAWSSVPSVSAPSLPSGGRGRPSLPSGGSAATPPQCSRILYVTQMTRKDIAALAAAAAAMVVAAVLFLLGTGTESSAPGARGGSASPPPAAGRPRPGAPKRLGCASACSSGNAFGCGLVGRRITCNASGCLLGALLGLLSGAL